MQTHFSKEQLKDKDNKSSEKIFRKCVHCGFCNATCPTYQLLGDELDGPRGRIYLIKDMLENNKPANAKIVKHGGYITMIKNSDYLPYVEDVFTINRDRFNISQNIKKSFDPKRILNPGKMYTGI